MAIRQHDAEGNSSLIASTNVTGDTLPIGSQIPFGSLTIPDNWILCDGSAVSRMEYSELFAVIGTSYGAGDGTTTFNLPNKKGRTSVGYDSSQTEFNTIGKTGGAKTHTLTVNEMPSHKHYGVRRYDVGVAGSGSLGSSNNSGNADYNTNYEGGDEPHNNLQPYETDVWIIKAKQSAGVVATVVDTLDSTSPTDALSANMGRELKSSIDLISESDSGWLSLNSEIKYRKVNNIVTVIGNSLGTVTVGDDSYTNVGTLPEGYRPAYISNFEWSTRGGAYPARGGQINTKGVIALYLPSGQQTDYWGFTLTFLV